MLEAGKGGGETQEETPVSGGNGGTPENASPHLQVNFVNIYQQTCRGF